MKDQLQLHEIAGYLPYGLRIKILNHECDYVGIEYAEVNGHYFIGDSLHLTYVGGSAGKDGSVCKPILRPMSDLLKPEWNELSQDLDLDYRNPSGWGVDMQKDGNTIHWGLTGIFDVCDRLSKHHFDFKDLIGQGKAISIHDIPTK